jgi:hypothetical protein
MEDDDEGRAIPRNAVVYKQGDDGESPKFKKTVFLKDYWHVCIKRNMY